MEENGTGDLQLELTAFVPPDCNARVFLVRCRGGRRQKLRWTLTGRLSDRETHSRFVRGTTEGNCLLLRNPANTLFPGQTMLVTASESCTFAGENPYEVTCPVGESAVLIAGVYRSEEERRRILTLLEEGMRRPHWNGRKCGGVKKRRRWKFRRQTRL